MRVGDTELGDVAFVVLSDSAFEMVPPGQRGVIGVPVAAAIQTFRWRQNRELTIAFPSEPFSLNHANLSYDAEYPVTTAEVEGSKVNLGVDSGGKDTLLFPRFAEAFPQRMLETRKGTAHWYSADGEVTKDAMILPELRFKLGDFPILLRDAPVLLTETIKASGRYEGQLGMDALAQATELLIDLGAMKLELK